MSLSIEQGTKCSCVKAFYKGFRKFISPRVLGHFVVSAANKLIPFVSGCICTLTDPGQCLPPWHCGLIYYSPGKNPPGPSRTSGSQMTPQFLRYMSPTARVMPSTPITRWPPFQNTSPPAARTRACEGAYHEGPYLEPHLEL